MNEFNNNVTEEVVVDEAVAAKDAQDNKLMAVLSYLGLLFLVPLLTKAHEKSPFVKLHLNQGILVMAMLVVYWVVWGLLGFIRTPVMMVVPFVGSVPTGVYTRPWWTVLITSAMALFVGVMALIGIINAAKGEHKKLPLVGDLYTVFK